MNNDTAGFRVVLTTAGSEKQAEDLAHSLVERSLAACVNIVASVCSVYRWEGKIQRDAEALLVIKTTAARVPELEQALRELHSYEVPEFLVLRVDGGSPDYLDWITQSVR